MVSVKIEIHLIRAMPGGVFIRNSLPIHLRCTRISFHPCRNGYLTGRIEGSAIRNFYVAVRSVETQRLANCSVCPRGSAAKCSDVVIARGICGGGTGRTVVKFPIADDPA